MIERCLELLQRRAEGGHDGGYDVTPLSGPAVIGARAMVPLSPNLIHPKRQAGSLSRVGVKCRRATVPRRDTSTAKTTKRSMFGRAGFDLLRARLLSAA
jgi:hypothetical protein